MDKILGALDSQRENAGKASLADPVKDKILDELARMKKSQDELADKLRAEQREAMHRICQSQAEQMGMTLQHLTERLQENKELSQEAIEE